MTVKSFDQLVSDAIAQEHHGWDFSFVNGRMIEEPLAWDYMALAGERLSSATAAVDLCTGGGELARQFKELPSVMYATEYHGPNQSIASEQLAPLGVRVVFEEQQLPDDTFDLVVNRHGSFNSAQLHRISRSEAIFLTQQVGSDNLLELNKALGSEATGDPWNAGLATSNLQSNGFEIVQLREQSYVTRFMDIGAVVFYLCAVPWQIRDFGVDRYSSELQQLYEHIQEQGAFEAKAHRFLIEAKHIS